LRNKQIRREREAREGQQTRIDVQSVARIVQIGEAMNEAEKRTEVSTATAGVPQGYSLPPDELIFGASEAMGKVREAVERVSRIRVPILIQGEGGTGKEVLARIIHRRYPGEAMPFLKVGFREIRDDLLHEMSLPRLLEDDRQSAGTEQERGCYGGTLFVRQVAELPPPSQRKLMRYLDDDPSPSSQPSENGRNRLRLICSSTSPLEREVAAGKFLRDVFHCINVASLHLLPLRDRRGDIPHLVQYLWRRYNHEFGCRTEAPSAQLLQFFQHYDWPGNLRELANVMKRYVLFGSEEAVLGELAGRENAVPGIEFAGSNALSLKKVVRQAAREMEHRIILRALRDHRWNRKQAARALNISYRAFLYKVKEAGVPPKKNRPRADRVGARAMWPSAREQCNTFPD
jgi:two-component system response regulator AtoC